MSTMPPQMVLALVHVRRNLRGTIKAGEQALVAIERILETIRPLCKSCLFERGIVGNVDARKNPKLIEVPLNPMVATYQDF